ncbi:hypothetical protein ACFRJ7_03145 [Streptomyces sp. NPDC056747]|uniref:hypothetical protein n=1 Tax=Streptomyces sp. NPDC056747 TaxID=3345935 RepID=UPI0036AC76B7
MAGNLVGKSQQDGIPGVYGGNDANGNGVVGETNGTGDGVFGQSHTGNGVVGRGWAFGKRGVWGIFDDDEQSPPSSAHFAVAVSAGVWGTTSNVAEVATDPVLKLKTASGVVGEVSLPGHGFGYGVLGVGHRDEGVVGWSELGAGGSFHGATSGIIAKSTKSGQIRLVPREADFGEDPQGNPRPHLPKRAESGEMTMVTKAGKCSLWLCVKSWQPGGGVVPETSARWAEVKLGASFNGVTGTT